MRKIKRKNQDQQKETKQRYASCKNLDIVTKSKIEQKNTKQHQIGRINLDRFIKRKNHHRKKKQHQKKKQKKKRQKDGECRNNIFENLRGKSMVHPSILHTQAFKLLEKDFLKAIQESPACICDVYWKFEWKKCD